MISRLMCAGVMICLLACSLARAQQQVPAKSTVAATYPTRPIRTLNDFAPVSLVDVMSGQVPVTFGTVPTVLQRIKAGRLRALGLTGARRSLSAPDVPTISEAGVPGYEAATWHGVLAPARTPDAIVAKLNSEVVRMLKDADVRARLGREGLEPIGSNPEQMDTHLRTEIPKWAQVIRTAGIRAE